MRAYVTTAGMALGLSLYGRFWCRSSLEVLRQRRTGAAGMWSRAM